MSNFKKEKELATLVGRYTIYRKNSGNKPFLLSITHENLVVKAVKPREYKYAQFEEAIAGLREAMKSDLLEYQRDLNREMAKADKQIKDLTTLQGNFSHFEKPTD